jgi:hypothetical protein
MSNNQFHVLHYVVNILNGDGSITSEKRKFNQIQLDSIGATLEHNGVSIVDANRIVNKWNSQTKNGKLHYYIDLVAEKAHGDILYAMAYERAHGDILYAMAYERALNVIAKGGNSKG